MGIYQVPISMILLTEYIFNYYNKKRMMWGFSLMCIQFSALNVGNEMKTSLVQIFANTSNKAYLFFNHYHEKWVIRFS